MTSSTFHRRSARRALLALASVVSLLAAGVAAAQEDECAASCRETAGDCHFDVRERLAVCLEGEGCDVLREDYRSECLTSERDEEMCADMRDALRECSMPCREALREEAQACRDAGAACLEDECGLEAPQRRGFGPRRGIR